MVKRVNDAGFFAFVVTNQSGVARGLHDEAAVLALHARMQHELRSVGAHIDDFRYCPHHPEGLVEKYAVSCNCRKPEPGMILDLLDHWPVEIGSSVLIGDKATDIEAGTRAGLRTLRFPDEIAALPRLLDAAAAESPPQSSTAELPI
jgi:D-glycero-D-manno-heptose 1,7-bisphosphate phosphatase